LASRSPPPQRFLGTGVTNTTFFLSALPIPLFHGFPNSWGGWPTPPVSVALNGGFIREFRPAPSTEIIVGLQHVSVARVLSVVGALQRIEHQRAVSLGSWGMGPLEVTCFRDRAIFPLKGLRRVSVSLPVYRLADRSTSGGRFSGRIDFWVFPLTRGGYFFPGAPSRPRPSCCFESWT